jgi:hypothetical protein
MNNTYEIRFVASKFGTVLTPTEEGGLRVVCGIRIEHGYATLTRRSIAGTVFAEHDSLGYTTAIREESVKIHMISNDAIRVAHEVITDWIGA